MSSGDPVASFNALSSPTFSAATNSSFDLVSLPSSLSDASVTSHSSNDESDEEIVWSVSSGYLSVSEDSERSADLLSEDDYVVLSRRRSPVPGSTSPGVDPRTPRPSDLVHSMKKLPSSDSHHSPKRKHGKPTTAGATQTQSLTKAQHKKRKKQVGGNKPAASKDLVPKSFYHFKGTGFGSRPIVDDLSETLDNLSVTDEESVVSSMYDDAVNYITSFLSNPTHDSVSTLTFLQSLIIELGLATSTLPKSLSSARAVLKSSAFVNIRDYLAVRGEGLAAIQEVMYPSKTALIKDIKRRRNTAPVRWVKQNGLQVLLVSCYH